MHRLKQIFIITRLYIVVIPMLIWFLGCASNQLVFVANGNKFPVMLNEAKKGEYQIKYGDMIDYRHCVMSKYTHLNLLADIFDFHDEGMCSIGDIFIDYGNDLSPYAMFLWSLLIMLDVISKDKKIKELEDGYDPYSY